MGRAGSWSHAKAPSYTETAGLCLAVYLGQGTVCSLQFLPGSHDCRAGLLWSQASISKFYICAPKEFLKTGRLLVSQSLPLEDEYWDPQGPKQHTSRPLPPEASPSIPPEPLLSLLKLTRGTKPHPPHSIHGNSIQVIWDTGQACN